MAVFVQNVSCTRTLALVLSWCVKATVSAIVDVFRALIHVLARRPVFQKVKAGPAGALEASGDVHANLRAVVHVFVKALVNVLAPMPVKTIELEAFIANAPIGAWGVLAQVLAQVRLLSTLVNIVARALISVQLEALPASAFIIQRTRIRFRAFLRARVIVRISAYVHGYARHLVRS